MVPEHLLKLLHDEDKAKCTSLVLWPLRECGSRISLYLNRWPTVSAGHSAVTFICLTFENDRCSTVQQDYSNKIPNQSRKKKNKTKFWRTLPIHIFAEIWFSDCMVLHSLLNTFLLTTISSCCHYVLFQNEALPASLYRCIIKMSFLATKIT